MTTSLPPTHDDLALIRARADRADDYAIALQRLIEAHCRGDVVDLTASPHLGACLNAHHAAGLADQRVAHAARVFAEAKEAAREAWIEHGAVPPTLTNTLDKATDNLLTAVHAA